LAVTWVFFQAFGEVSEVVLVVRAASLASRRCAPGSVPWASIFFAASAPSRASPVEAERRRRPAPAHPAILNSAPESGSAAPCPSGILRS
jgi:hypothetical protein